MQDQDTDQAGGSPARNALRDLRKQTQAHYPCDQLAAALDHLEEIQGAAQQLLAVMGISDAVSLSEENDRLRGLLALHDSEDATAESMLEDVQRSRDELDRLYEVEAEARAATGLRGTYGEWRPHWDRLCELVGTADSDLTRSRAQEAR